MTQHIATDAITITPTNVMITNDSITVMLGPVNHPVKIVVTNMPIIEMLAHVNKATAHRAVCDPQHPSPEHAAGFRPPKACCWAIAAPNAV
mmetsp:Transcript_8313/g.27226  ORF Transcript_8313/g.27226 Transcript_8313/m.27226 type:complete len:91 (-) Transcript_8313:1045-1317(-)